MVSAHQRQGEVGTALGIIIIKETISICIADVNVWV